MDTDVRKVNIVNLYDGNAVQMSYPAVSGLYANLVRELIKRKMTVSTMESCTGGMIECMLTDTEGASSVTEGSFVTYSNRAKEMQGVDGDIIKEYGVYSMETAGNMAVACAQAYGTDFGIGISGTIGRLDPNNEDSADGKVYVSIVRMIEDEDGGRRFWSNHVFKLPEGGERFERKLMVAMATAQALSNALDDFAF